MSDPNIPASEQAERENLSHLRPDVLRVVVGLVSNSELMPELIEQSDNEIRVARAVAMMALDIVRGVDHVCGVDDE